MPKSYIYFELIAKKPKTSVYAIRSKSSGDVLGHIRWYFGWRQYIFEPETSEDTIWNIGCLREVIDFLQKLMDDRKIAKKGLLPYVKMP